MRLRPKSHASLELPQGIDGFQYLHSICDNALGSPLLFASATIARYKSPNRPAANYSSENCLKQQSTGLRRRSIVPFVSCGKNGKLFSYRASSDFPAAGQRFHLRFFCRGQERTNDGKLRIVIPDGVQTGWLLPVFRMGDSASHVCAHGANRCSHRFRKKRSDVSTLER